MPCSPSSNNINVPSINPPSIPGFGFPFSSLQIPIPDLDLPTDLLEDILGLVNQLGALFPSGLFKPNPDFSMKTVLDFISNILSQIAPFLSFYQFILAALKFALCLLECICAIPNPFAVASKLKKLFSECLPPFIALFPWIALIAMIIAFLLLILALIEYIINLIISIIEALVKNLTVLAKGVTLQDAQSTLAAIQKIASLLCFIQNILAVLVAIAAIIAIIKALASFAGAGICDDSDSEGCCAPAICPDFVKNTPNGISVADGTLIYYNQIGPDIANMFSSLNIPGIENLLAGIGPIRKERWQLVDNHFEQATYPISQIITPVIDINEILSGNTGNIFWPDPLEFAADSQKNKVPYTVDVRLEVNPTVFGIADTKGLRFFQIKDCLVVRKPYFGIINQDNLILLTNLGGTLNIEGGLVYEDDGKTPFKVNGKQATLNTFIHKSNTLAASANALPATDDAVVFANISFTWKPNSPCLAGYGLVTVGCMPGVSIEKAVQNAIINAEGIEPVLVKLNGKVAPDVEGTLACCQTALATFRNDVSAAGAGVFQASITSCLTNFQKETQDILCAAINAAISVFKSSASLDTDVQFTTRAIKTTVVLKDPTGTNISTNIPDDCASDISKKLKGDVTFGSITDFNYNKTDGNFTAEITSKIPGSGKLSITYDGKDFNTVTTGTGTTNSSINQLFLDYTFIDGISEPEVRRDETDTSNMET